MKQKIIGVPMRHGKTLRILQEYEKQKAEGKTCKLVTKEGYEKEKTREDILDVGIPKQGEATRK